MSTHKKRMFCDQQGDVLQIVDDREVEDVRDYRLASIRRRANRAIEEAVPEYKQRNIAMGIVTGDEKAELLAKINEVRGYCNGLEDQINQVSWDGEESTRAQACDEIEAVSWNFVSQL